MSSAEAPFDAACLLPAAAAAPAASLGAPDAVAAVAALLQRAVFEGVPAAIREEAAEVPTSAGVAPEAAASAAFDAATDAMSDLTCPEGTMFSINGCNALCLVCVLLVENSCPPCSIGADDAGALPCVADCCAEVALFSDEFGGWGTKAGDDPEVLLFSDELGCALFSDEQVVRCFQMSLVAGARRLGMIQRCCCFQMS